MTPAPIKLNALTVGSLQLIQNMAGEGISAPGCEGRGLWGWLQGQATSVVVPGPELRI